MRPLTEEETKNVFEKLHKFMGKNIKALVDRGSGEPHCLRLQKNRVFYVREDMMRRATNVRVVPCAVCRVPARPGRRGSGVQCSAVQCSAVESAVVVAAETLRREQRSGMCCAHRDDALLLLLMSLLLPQVAREKLVALGTCIGRFTHSGKFRVTIGALDLLAQYAKYKVRRWRRRGAGGAEAGALRRVRCRAGDAKPFNPSVFKPNKLHVEPIEISNT